MQFMPLVGVPSFIEFSQKRDLHYFFVLVRRQGSPAATSLGDTGEHPGSIDIRQSAPTEAFEVASAAEPWGTVEVAASQEEKEAKRAALEAMEQSLKDKPQKATTVKLPFNSEVSWLNVLCDAQLQGRAIFSLASLASNAEMLL